MQATQAITTIDRELLTAGVEPHDSMRRARIASAIKQTGAYFGQNEAVRLRAHFSVGYVGNAADEFLRESLLDGSWVEIVAKVSEQERTRDPNEKSAESHLRHVTEANPYGWQKPELQRGSMDHDIPGAWNSFRQCFNLTAEERARYATRDHRVRGCTRWEVIGKDRNPHVQFDAMEVATALAKELGEVTSATGEREVYGANQ